MSADLFGSLTEAITAALIIGSNSPGLNQEAISYPFLIIASGILSSFITSLIPVKEATQKNIQTIIKR